MQSIAKRLDGKEEVVTKEVNVCTIATPDFLTLTKSPANQVAFKIVRDDTEEPAMTEETSKPVRRIRRGTSSALLTIEFLENTTDEEITAIVEAYGLTGYTVVQNACGKKSLQRSDLTEIPADAVSIRIGEYTAKIRRSAYAPPVASTPEDLNYISVVALEFEKSVFRTEEDCYKVVTRLDMDYLDGKGEITDTHFRILRTEVPEGADTRRVVVEPGLVAVVTRADVIDLGTTDLSFTEVVSESCYGNYGWGCVDFAMSLADEEYCDAASEAVEMFRSVVNRILFYSALPIAVRKELVSRASVQFSAYIGSLLDVLPTQVVLINRSHVDKELTMSNKTETGAATQEPAAATITRSEVEALIATAVAAAIEGLAKASTQVVRTEEVKTETPAAEPVSAVAQSIVTVSRSVEEVASAMEKVAERLKQIEGMTVARSDGGDTLVVEPKKDVFAGCLGGIGTR